MKKIVLNIEGMTCSACSNGLEKYLKKQDGVIDASVNLVMATAMIEYEEFLKDSSTTQRELLNLIEELNRRKDIHGILLQSPIPNRFRYKRSF